MPNRVAERINQQKRLHEYLLHRKLMETDPSYKEDYERKNQDTMPVMYVDDTTRGRPVIIVGGRGMWYKDMRDLALRLKEKPDPAKELSGQRNVKADTAAAIDRYKRRLVGTRSFHIKNNPCFREEW